MFVPSFLTTAFAATGLTRRIARRTCASTPPRARTPRFVVRAPRVDAPELVFNLVPLHLKAMAEGSLRRRMAAQLLSEAIRTLQSDESILPSGCSAATSNAELGSLRRTASRATHRMRPAATHLLPRLLHPRKNHPYLGFLLVLRLRPRGLKIRVSVVRLRPWAPLRGARRCATFEPAARPRQGLRRHPRPPQRMSAAVLPAVWRLLFAIRGLASREAASDIVVAAVWRLLSAVHGSSLCDVAGARLGQSAGGGSLLPSSQVR